MSKKNTTPFTAAEVRTMFNDYGISITSFCAEHQLSRMAVVDLLRGEGKGLRGDSHRAAVLLGMKKDPITKNIHHPFEKEKKAA